MNNVAVGGASAGTVSPVRAIALRGFYRGEPLVNPGDILELSGREFLELKSMNLVDYAPPEPEPEPAKAEAKAKK